MFQLQDPEIISVSRFGQISRQSAQTQEKKSPQQILQLIGYINTLTDHEQLQFKTKILSLAKIRSKELGIAQVEQVLSLEERKYILEYQKFIFNVKVQNWKIRTEFIKIIILLIWIIVIAFGIYAYILQAPSIVVPTGESIQLRQPAGGAMLIGLLIILVSVIIPTSLFQKKKQ